MFAAILLRCLLSGCAVSMLSAGLQAATPAREEALFLFENRRVVIAVPEGFAFGSAKDDLGIIRVQLQAPDDVVSVMLTFLPDPERRFADAYARHRFLFESFSEFAEQSVEEAMQFEELKPRSGAGTYCVFTDAKLVGRKQLPPGEFLHATKGVKTWPGVMVVFSLFSQDTTSREYEAVMRMLRESVEERSVPLR